MDRFVKQHTCGKLHRQRHQATDLAWMLWIFAATLSGASLGAESWDYAQRRDLTLTGGTQQALVVEMPVDHLASVYTEHLGQVTLFHFSPESLTATKVWDQNDSQVPTMLRLDKKKPNHQFKDGRWCLVPSNKAAKTQGGIIWKGNFQASRPGSYSAECYFKSNSVRDLKFIFLLADSKASREISSIDHPSLTQALPLGKVKIPASGEIEWSLQVNGGSQEEITLSHIVLRPTQDGEPIRQLADGSILLHARDATTHGTKLQYEPEPHKNTLGYWVNELDYPAWQFELLRPGLYGVELLQGCGKGHGGSEVKLQIHDTTLQFLIEETGHFQHFVPRIVGEVHLPRPDRYQVELKPQRKAGGAVMDVRQIRLIPVAEKP
ncbi:MAG: hypothetical protein P8L18_08050 [Verrucomicrobiota bacterium]|nr:hypothetical protein [Verrucomicrobiota bacterium]